MTLAGRLPNASDRDLADSGRVGPGRSESEAVPLIPPGPVQLGPGLKHAGGVVPPAQPACETVRQCGRVIGGPRSTPPPGPRAALPGARLFKFRVHGDQPWTRDATYSDATDMVRVNVTVTVGE